METKPADDKTEKFNATKHISQRVSQFDLNDESYFFRSVLADGRKICVDKCMVQHLGNLVTNNEKICLRRCQDVMMHIGLSSFFTAQAALTLDEIVKGHAVKVLD